MFCFKYGKISITNLTAIALSLPVNEDILLLCLAVLFLFDTKHGLLKHKCGSPKNYIRFHMCCTTEFQSRHSISERIVGCRKYLPLDRVVDIVVSGICQITMKVTAEPV